MTKEVNLWNQVGQPITKKVNHVTKEVNYITKKVNQYNQEGQPI